MHWIRVRTARSWAEASGGKRVGMGGVWGRLLSALFAISAVQVVACSVDTSGITYGHGGANAGNGAKSGGAPNGGAAGKGGAALAGGDNAESGGVSGSSVGGSDVGSSEGGDVGTAEGGKAGASGIGDMSCDAGSPCDPEDVCHQGETVCTDGVASCRDTGSLRDNGTACGENATCRDGECVTCGEGMSCEITANVCRAGTVACGTGEPVCTETDNVTNGTPCGAGQVCQAGECASCRTGDACTPENHCHIGTLS